MADVQAVTLFLLVLVTRHARRAPTAQRRELIRLRNVGEIGDDALNAVQRELDLE